jgi:hypothetical protein
VLFALLEDLRCKVIAQGRFTSGESHAPAGRKIKRFVRKYFVHHLADAHRPAFHLKSTGEACLHARTVQEAPFAKKCVNTFTHFMGVVGTGDDALTAGDTSFGVVAEFRLRVLSLRIMAPEAAHGASLQKHSGADARAVVQGETLNVKNNVSSVHDNAVREDAMSCTTKPVLEKNREIESFPALLFNISLLLT